MRIDHWLVLVYTLVSVLALAAIPLSAAGWITPDPLSAIPAMLVGLPWSHLLVSLVDTDSMPVNVLLLVAAMAINGCLLWVLGRFASRLCGGIRTARSTTPGILRQISSLLQVSSLIAATERGDFVMRHALSITVFATFILALATSAFAADEIRTEQVHFKPGMTGATIKGKIKGYETVDYVLEASKGQHMNVSMNTDNASSYFNIIAPGESDVAMFIGPTSGNEYKSELPKSGNYKIRVYMMRSAARRNEVAKYRLEMTVTGDAQTTSSGSSDAKGTPSKDEQACLQAVSIETNNGEVTVLSTETSEANNVVMIGVGANKAPWRCLVSKGVVAEVMSMTDEGRL